MPDVSKFLPLCFIASCLGHAVLVRPPGRPVGALPGQGTKLTPFNDARFTANRGCGAPDNPIGNVQQPTLAFTPGASIPIEWELTIPHDADNSDTGVRIAMYYEPNDGFECNILAGGMEGDPNWGNYQGTVNPKILPAGPPGAAAGTKVRTLITLHPNKTCDYWCAPP